VAVLDQEEAKKFLTGKEEDKYQFFTKATELERLDRTYASIQDNIEEQKEARDRALSALEGTRENAKRLKKEWEQFQELDKLEAECQQARAMCGWAIHSEFSQELEAELKSRAKLQKNLEKRQLELRDAEDAVNVTDDEEIAAKNRLQELIAESTEAANNKIQLEQELKRATQPLKHKEREHQIIEKELAAAKKRLKSAQFRLEKARREVIESAGNAAEEERVRTRKIAQLESDIAHGKPKLDPLKERIADELHRYQDMEPEEGQKKEVREATERQVRLRFLRECFFMICLLFVFYDCHSTYAHSCKQSSARSKTSNMRLEGVTSLWQCLVQRCESFVVDRHTVSLLYASPALFIRPNSTHLKCKVSHSCVPCIPFCPGNISTRIILMVLTVHLCNETRPCMSWFRKRSTRNSSKALVRKNVDLHQDFLPLM
jgi:hypothetical protein